MVDDFSYRGFSFMIRLYVCDMLFGKSHYEIDANIYIRFKNDSNFSNGNYYIHETIKFENLFALHIENENY